MSQTNEFKPRTIRLVGPQQVATAHAALDNAPIGQAELECVIRPVTKTRGLDANARMWAGPLRDMEEQAWVAGRRYSAEIWHELFKEMFLPELDDPELDELVKDPENWKKWDFKPNGDRVLVGSTTQLTRKGFARYTEQITAHGSGLGVMFSASPREYR